MLKSIQYFSIFLLGILVLGACSETDSVFSPPTPTEVAPQLPNTETMKMDLSAFDEEATSDGEASNEEFSNFNNAVFQAYLLEVVVNWNLGLPSKIFDAAANTQATLNGQGKWVWSYSTRANSDRYEVRLLGDREDANTISWQCYVTSTELGIENFLLFEGNSNNDGTQGTWYHYDIVTLDDENRATINEWSKQGDDLTLNIEVLPDGNEFSGDIIEFATDGTVNDAYFYNANLDTTTELQWNNETLVGYLITSNYNNGEKACWDSTLKNGTCEEE